MKSNRGIFRIILMVSITMLLSNCATKLSHNLEPNFAKIEKIHTKYFRIHTVNVNGLDSTVTVQAKIEHRSVFGQHAKGHIDVSMIAPRGEVLDEVSIRPRGWRANHRHKRRVIRDASFNVILDTPPLMGSIIRMGFHKSSEPGESQLFDCGTNIASPAS